jgi:hypothetical protein
MCFRLIVLTIIMIILPVISCSGGELSGAFRLGKAQVRISKNQIESRFNWQPSIGASSYGLVVYSDKELKNIIAEKKATTNKARVSGLPSDTKLYWRVEAIDGKTRNWNSGEPGVFNTPIVTVGKLTITIPRGTATMDGKIRPEEWDKAVVMKLNNYIMGQKAEEDKAPYCKLMWDDRALYILGEAYFPGGRDFQATQQPRDGSIWASDAFEIVLYGPGRTNKLHFIINATDSIYDAKAGDAGWNPEWEHFVQVRPGGMTVVMALPFTSLGEVPAVGNEWRGNICLDMNGQALVPSWAKDSAPFGYLERMGYIVLGK